LKKVIFKPGTTSVLIGSSGVGKSSLINEFMHSGRKTSEISDATGKGKNTSIKSQRLNYHGSHIYISARLKKPGRFLVPLPKPSRKYGGSE
jgi:putative ribosome biogenesis GTPase RsgA